jgi:hypothetical protein
VDTTVILAGPGSAVAEQDRALPISAAPARAGRPHREGSRETVTGERGRSLFHLHRHGLSLCTWGKQPTMSTGAIIGIVVGAVLVIALIVVALRASRRRRLEGRRTEASELRTDARQREATAEDARAAADEQAARAERVRAEAQEKEAAARREEVVAQKRGEVAEHQTVAAREQHDRARSVDPDVADSGEDEAVALNDDAASARD